MIISNTTHSIFVTQAAPVDAKMIVSDFDKFDSRNQKSKWNGMLVFVESVGKWHTYDAGQDKLVLFEQGGGSGSSSLIVPNGKKIIWKFPNNVNEEILEANDVIEGFIENKFVKAKYVSGADNLLSSYQILEEYTIV